jgi:hypothetical protein
MSFYQTLACICMHACMISFILSYHYYYHCCCSQHRYNADEAYRHSWSIECANLASLLVSSGRDLIYEWTSCGSRGGAVVQDQDL